MHHASLSSPSPPRSSSSAPSSSSTNRDGSKDARGLRVRLALKVSARLAVSAARTSPSVSSSQSTAPGTRVVRRAHSPKVPASSFSSRLTAPPQNRPKGPSSGYASMGKCHPKQICCGERYGRLAAPGREGADRSRARRRRPAARRPRGRPRRRPVCPRSRRR
jgi:hypothetical protein